MINIHYTLKDLFVNFNTIKYLNYSKVHFPSVYSITNLVLSLLTKTLTTKDSYPYYRKKFVNQTTIKLTILIKMFHESEKYTKQIQKLSNLFHEPEKYTKQVQKPSNLFHKLEQHII